MSKTNQKAHTHTTYVREHAKNMIDKYVTNESEQGIQFHGLADKRVGNT